MGFIHPTIFVTAALQKHKKFHLVTCWSVALAYDLAKHKICSSPITRNVGPRSWFQCGFLLSGHATPCFTLQGGPYPSAQQRAAVPCITRIFCQLSFLQNIFICSDHEINPTDHKSITALPFPDEGFTSIWPQNFDILAQLAQSLQVYIYHSNKDFHLWR